MKTPTETPRGAEMWDQRYQTDQYVYGTEPNGFLESVADRIPQGKVLCLAEGEGRNAVFLAQRGYEVVAVDASAVGLAKAQRLARERGVVIETVVTDLAAFTIEPDSWDGIISIFCHLPPGLRKSLHRQVVRGLRPGGLFVLEGYTPAQVGRGTGGPPTEELMMTRDALREELEGLDFLHAVETERPVVEGTLHTGIGAVVQLLAVKPA
jgi:SAM-dependent methyltransferase